MRVGISAITRSEISSFLSETTGFFVLGALCSTLTYIFYVAHVAVPNLCREIAMQQSSTRHHRRTSRIPVNIVLNKYIRGRPYIARASNISRHGLLVHRLFEPDNDEQTIGLKFQLPGSDHTISCVGQVVYEHHWLPANGIKLTHIAPDHQRLLDDYVLSHPPASHGAIC